MAIDRSLRAMAVAAKRCPEGHSWREIADGIGQKSWKRCRAWFLRWPKGEQAGACPICHRAGSSFEEHGNYAEATVTDERITTLDELLARCAVDLETWAVRDWGVKKWEVGAKIKEGHLEWTAGALDGHLTYKGLGVQDLWSVWAKFIRRAPVQILPAVQPAMVAVSWAAPADKEREGAERAFVICDCQFGFRKRVRDAKLVPFHDRRVLDVALQICEDEQPDLILFLGDTADLADWSGKFIKEPSFYFTTQPMVLEVPWWLAQFRERCQDARIVVSQGNHEARMPNALLTHLAAAYGLRAADELELPPQMSLPRLWALHQLGVEWAGGYPDDEVWLSPWLRAKHGNKASAQPGGTARAQLVAGVSTIFAHAHRKESASAIVMAQGGPRTIHAYSPGCACHRDGRVPGHKRDDNWQQGLGLVAFTEDGMFAAQDTEVVEGRALWGGRVYEARERLGDLQRDLPGWNW